MKRLPKGTLQAPGRAQEGVRMRGTVQRELRGGSSSSAQWGVKAWPAWSCYSLKAGHCNIVSGISVRAHQH